MNYYNDNDPKACAWLRELIAQGHLPPGAVDERSILEIKPDDLTGFDQCHFFAGVGGWPLALRWAGLEGVAGIWTGSCPCQPLSCAGKRQGHADERHLWPAFHALIAERRPATVFGEQVASKDGREWFSGVRLDLEGLGYACGGADLCAAGVGAPHRRQRLFWVADSIDGGRQDRRAGDTGALRAAHCGWDAFAVQRAEVTEPGAGALRVADANGRNKGDGRLQRGWEHGQRAAHGGVVRLADAEHDGGRADEQGRKAQGRTADGRACGMGYATGRGCGVGGDAAQPGRGGHADRAGWTGDAAGGMAHSEGSRQPQQYEHDCKPEAGSGAVARGAHACGRGYSFWSRFDILPCRDGKARRVESQSQQMVDGVSAHLDALRNAGLDEDQICAAISTFPLTQHAVGRMMLLRGYGNSVCVPITYEFIMAAKETLRL